MSKTGLRIAGTDSTTSVFATAVMLLLVPISFAGTLSDHLPSDVISLAGMLYSLPLNVTVISALGLLTVPVMVNKPSVVRSINSFSFTTSSPATTSIEISGNNTASSIGLPSWLVVVASISSPSFNGMSVVTVHLPSLSAITGGNFVPFGKVTTTSLPGSV